MTEWCGWPVVAEPTGWEAAQQILAVADLSDGLPLVPPTQRRLDAMVAGMAARADSLGMCTGAGRPSSRSNSANSCASSLSVLRRLSAINLSLLGLTTVTTAPNFFKR